ncbi:MAG TPA: Smr/MutS family protein [Gammaproteobacteria bacterium]|nr:Smr/MutS family protein [Gammaproteobacteria bacterium]
MSRKKPEVEEDELALFREAMRDVRPLQAPERVEHRRRPKPVPRFRLADESNALLESLREDPFRSELETGEELLYLRAGENPRLLRRLRRGEFPIAAELDLHGLTEQRAGIAIREFLAEAQRERWQCVRIIHGKGLRSGPDGPVLKPKTASVLRRRDDVLAFANARPVDGGTGAVLVLLRRR